MLYGAFSLVWPYQAGSCLKHSSRYECSDCVVDLLPLFQRVKLVAENRPGCMSVNAVMCERHQLIRIAWMYINYHRTSLSITEWHACSRRLGEPSHFNGISFLTKALANECTSAIIVDHFSNNDHSTNCSRAAHSWNEEKRKAWT